MMFVVKQIRKNIDQKAYFKLNRKENLGDGQKGMKKTFPNKQPTNQMKTSIYLALLITKNDLWTPQSHQQSQKAQLQPQDYIY